MIFMPNRIQSLFANKRSGILSVFFTAGFPSLNDTEVIGEALESSGADLVEIGVPFSDPVADGPVIQESNKIALDNGISVRKILGQVRDLRARTKFPIILMGYLNPVLQFGLDAFCREASGAGADGLILPDLPMDEYLEDYKQVFEKYGLLNIFLISPTTSEKRIREIDEVSNGFIYAVSASSTTGVKGEFTNEQEQYFKRLAEMKLKNPLLIGFGISNHSTFAKACQFASGAIIGSAFISMLKNSKNLHGDIRSFVENIRQQP